MRSHIWRYGVLVALLSFASSMMTLRNNYTQDDRPAIVEDGRAHDPAQWRRYWSEPYWASQFGGDLYRPMSSTTMAAQWTMGGGAPFAFKAVSVAVYAAASIAVFYLALAVTGPVTALVAAMLFAVHPVHVEAVAVAVNQAEIIVCLLMALAVGRYITDRRRNQVDGRTRWLLFGATLVGVLYKETAAVLPALLLAAEGIILLRTPRRWRELFDVMALQGLAIATAGVLRYRVHGSNMRATFTAEAISGATMWERLLSMLGGVVPEWFRLLLWPANLQADYSPRVIDPAVTWETPQTLGLAIILLVAFLAWRLRHRAPAFSFGVTWTAIGLLPVSNVLVPTGIMLAERTLITPSVGAMLAVAALGSLAVRAVGARRRPLARQAGYAVVAVVLVMGISRSYSRHQVWRTQLGLWRQTVIDAPDGYRGRVALGGLMLEMGWTDRGEAQLLEGIALWDGSSGPIFTLADRYRHSERCVEAVALYEKALAIEEFAPGRAGMVSCRAFLGQYAQARREAFDGLRIGFYSEIFRVWIRTLDQAMRTDAPAGTVRFPVNMNHLFESAVREEGVLGRTRVAKGVHVMPDSGQ